MLAADAPRLPYDPHYSYWRQIAVLWVFFYLSSLLLYFSVACTTYYMFFRDTRKEKPNPDGTTNDAWWKPEKGQIKQEIFTSVWSLFIMAGMTAPCEFAIVQGYGKVRVFAAAICCVARLLFLLFAAC